MFKDVACLIRGQFGVFKYFLLSLFTLLRCVEDAKIVAIYRRNAVCIELLAQRSGLSS